MARASRGGGGRRRQALQSAQRPGRWPPPGPLAHPPSPVRCASFVPLRCPRPKLDRICPPREARLGPRTGALPVARRAEGLLAVDEAKTSTTAHVPGAGFGKASLAQHLECRPLTGGRPDSMLHSNALQPRHSAEPRGPAAPFPGANHEPLKTPARPCLSPPRPPSRPPSAPEWWGLGRSSSLVTLGGWIERKGGHDAYQDEASDELPESSPSLLFFTMINRAVW